MGKAFSEVSAEPQPMFLWFRRDKCNAHNNLPSCMHAVKNIPPLQPFENVPSSTICGSKCFTIVSKKQEVPEKLSQVCFIGLFFNNWPSTSWAIMCVMWDKLKQVLQAAPSFIFWWQKGSSWTSGLCLLLLKRTQSVPLTSVLLPSCLFIFYIPSIFSM